jgi:hypothetical protein
VSVPSAAELVAGLGHPQEIAVCGEHVGWSTDGEPVTCGWVSGWYHDPREAGKALIEHLVISHHKRRPAGTDDLAQGVVAEWRAWCAKNDLPQ